jgi:hypothetical protein
MHEIPDQDRPRQRAGVTSPRDGRARRPLDRTLVGPILGVIWAVSMRVGGADARPSSPAEPGRAALRGRETAGPRRERP